MAATRSSATRSTTVVRLEPAAMLTMTVSRSTNAMQAAGYRVLAVRSVMSVMQRWAGACKVVVWDQVVVVLMETVVW
jgi:hypothetical protein